MYIIYVKNYKIKLFVTVFILLFWVAAFFLAELLLHHSLAFKITINNYLTFSYPLEMEVDNVYVNQYYDSSIETTSNTSKPLTTKFQDFKSLEGKFGFSYPSAFKLQPQEFTGSEIIYHIDFHSKNNTAHGFVQVWNMPYPVDEFLQKAKSTSRQQYKHFTTKEVTVQDLPGYYWDYAVLAKNGKYYKGSEVFLQKDSRIFRISFFVPEDLWNKEHSETFWKIVQSFKTY